MVIGEIIGLLLGGGGIGSLLTCLIKFKSEKRIANANASKSENDMNNSKFE